MYIWSVSKLMWGCESKEYLETGVTFYPGFYESYIQALTWVHLPGLRCLMQWT